MKDVSCFSETRFSGPVPPQWKTKEARLPKPDAVYVDTEAWCGVWVGPDGRQPNGSIRKEIQNPLVFCYGDTWYHLTYAALHSDCSTCDGPVRGYIEIATVTVL
jgi:hypothetical protein